MVCGGPEDIPGRAWSHLTFLLTQRVHPLLRGTPTIVAVVGGGGPCSVSVKQRRPRPGFRSRRAMSLSTPRRPCCRALRLSHVQPRSRSGPSQARAAKEGRRRGLTRSTAVFALFCLAPVDPRALDGSRQPVTQGQVSHVSAGEAGYYPRYIHGHLLTSAGRYIGVDFAVEVRAAVPPASGQQTSQGTGSRGCRSRSWGTGVRSAGARHGTAPVWGIIGLGNMYVHTVHVGVHTGQEKKGGMREGF